MCPSGLAAAGNLRQRLELTENVKSHTLVMSFTCEQLGCFLEISSGRNLF